MGNIPRQLLQRMRPRSLGHELYGGDGSRTLSGRLRASEARALQTLLSVPKILQQARWQEMLMAAPRRSL